MRIFELLIASGWQTWIIPFVAAFVGWWTNALAVKMMFKPTEFVGIKPYLGWQGLVPAAAPRLAGNAVDLIRERLFTVKDLFAGFDAEQMAKELGPSLDLLAESLTQDVIAKHAEAASPSFAKVQCADAWDAYLEELERSVMRAMLRAEIERTVVDILRDLHANVDKIIDLRKVVMREVAQDKGRISDVFLTVGSKELRFVELSGLYFGLPFGILQMLLWVLWPVWWTLPMAGFAVGYVTNWIALKLVFHPRKPIRVGPWTLQGLFHKRQQVVAARYGEVVARNLLSPANIVRTLSSGENSALLSTIVRRHVNALLDRYEKDPIAGRQFPRDEPEALRAEILARVEAELPKPGGFLHQLIAKAMDLEGELVRRMVQLDPESFEGVLRPAFQESEWKLIAVGGVLGFAAGFVQLVTCFGQVWMAAMH